MMLNLKLRYKYPERYPEKPQLAYRQQGEVFLQALENQLKVSTYLHGKTASLADIAIFPFVRQFAAVDNIWFEQSEYPKLRAWLNVWLNADLFQSIMTKSPTYFG
jgi:glutathione S-transferase